MDYTVKNIKTLSSGAYTASLYEGGKRVAVIEDDGRGGAPYIRPIKAENYGKEMRRLEAALSTVELPEWYATTFGDHAALGPNWELAIGLLMERADYNKLAKTGRLIRKADGSLFRVPITVTVAAGTELLWNGSDWVRSI